MIGIDDGFVLETFAENRLGKDDRLRRRIGDPGNLGVRHQFDVLNALVAHHAGADKTVAKFS